MPYQKMVRYTHGASCQDEMGHDGSLLRASRAGCLLVVSGGASVSRIVVEYPGFVYMHGIQELQPLFHVDTDGVVER